MFSQFSAYNLILLESADKGFESLPAHQKPKPEHISGFGFFVAIAKVRLHEGVKRRSHVVMACKSHYFLLSPAPAS